MGAGGTPEPTDEDRESLSEWLLPVVPDMVVSGCEWSIKKAGRLANDPDPLWEKRFRTSYEKSLGHYVPSLEMHPAVALLIATLFLWLSMWWNAPKAKGSEAKKELNKASAPASAVPSAPAAEVDLCQTPATVPSPAASPPFAVASDEYVTSLGLMPPSGPPDASGDGGGATSAERSA
jgi:hypothetical protein